MPKKASYAERIREKIVVNSNGCWLWNGAKKPTGYGNFRFRERFVGAHVASYTVFVGEIPDGLYVIHKCDMPSCVNPEHLSVGTPAENQQDSVRKGRKTKRGPDLKKRAKWGSLTRNGQPVVLTERGISQ